MYNFAINICLKQNMIKIKQFLYLLALVSLIFSSCKKDDDKDYRDKFEGTYETDVVGSITDNIFIFIPVNYKEDINVDKVGAVQLMLVIGGEIVLVNVDEHGDFSVPPESGQMVNTDPEIGMTQTINLTVTVTGTITNKTLYIKETYSGNVFTEIGGEKYNSILTGAVVYNGKKIN